MEFNRELFARLLEKAQGSRSINAYAREVGLTGAHISRLLRCMLNTPPTPQTIAKLAAGAANGVSYQDFMQAAGYLETTDKASLLEQARSVIHQLEAKREVPGSISFERSRFFAAPVLGSIRGGPPQYASEELEGYYFVDPVISGVSESDEVFYLRVKGDSMQPKYLPGDLVLIKRQDYVEEGEVAAVLVGGEEATLKRVYPAGEQIWLYSTNPTYHPIKVNADDITIIGKAVLRVG
ncbi:MAG: LexA family protein [Methylocystaceae bacterium]